MLAVDHQPALSAGEPPDSGSSAPIKNCGVSSPPSLAASNTVRRFDKQASIVLIGVRGAGKRSLGFIAAAHLGRRFVTEGLFFENSTGTTKAVYLQSHGKDKFHRRTFEVFQQMLEQNDRGCVIECGMGSFTREAQALLLQYAMSHPVIHVVRNFDHIAQHLRLDTRQTEHLRDVDLSHRRCSNFEFYNLYDCSCLDETKVEAQDLSPNSVFVLQDVKIDFQNFVDSIIGTSKSEISGPFSLHSIPVEQKVRSYATSIRLSELMADTTDPEAFESGEDAIEICVDVWTKDVKTVISKQISFLRRKIGIPIIFSVTEAGLDPSKPTASAYLEMMDQGLRSGVNYITVDASLPAEHQKRLLSSKGNTKAIADHLLLDPTPRAWLDPKRLSICDAAKRAGYDIVRLRQQALEWQDNADVQHFQHMASLSANITIIAYNLGCYGKSSKIFNRVLTPVEHRESIVQRQCRDSGGGHIWAFEATTALFQCFEYDRLNFHVLGQSVSFSCAPAMYIAAYQFYGMGHSFSYRDMSSFDEILNLARDSFFGGAAISFPFKEKAFRACSVRSFHAEVIGSINTILPLRQLMGEKTNSLFEQANHRNRAGPVVGLYGDNSDWEGLYNNIRRRLSPRNAANCARSAGLVLGAGGSARSSIYALLHLGCQTVYVHNRTYDNARKVAEHFNAWIAARNKTGLRQSVLVLKSAELAWPRGASLPIIIVACVPTTTASFSGQIGETFELPEEWLGSPSGGVAADISYNPPNTPFLEQVRRLRESKRSPWAVVTGVDLVYEQAILQFEQMTGYRAPRTTMKKALAD